MSTQSYQNYQVFTQGTYGQYLIPTPNQATINPFSPTTHGSAKFADAIEVINSMLNNPGTRRTLAPIIGFIYDQNLIQISIFGRSPSSDHSLQTSNHLLTVAKTQSGKSSSQLITNLLSYEGSVLVNDPKTELYRSTSGYRARTLNHVVFRFAPEEFEDSNVWNPLSSIRTDLNAPYDKMTESQKANEQDDASFLAEMLITPSGNPEDRFWELLAMSILAGILLYVATVEISENDPSETSTESGTAGYDEEDSEEIKLLDQVKVRERSMYQVVMLLFSEPKAFQKLLEQMLQSTRPLIQQSAAHFKRLEKGEGKIAQSVFAMFVAQMNIWTSPRIRRVTYKQPHKPSQYNPPHSIVNDFEFSELATLSTTIYINFESDLSHSHSVLRVLFGTAMRQLKQQNRPLACNPADHDQPPVLFLLDEFATLGYMRPIEDALTYIAGYNVRFWFFVQDICQLKQHYPKSWSTFFSNTGTQCFYGINEIETAKLISEMLGYATVENYSFNNGMTTVPVTWYASSIASNNQSSTQANVSRSLMTPDEVQRASKDHMLILTHGMRPILGFFIKYYLRPELKERSEIPPQHIQTI